ncbi:helix-turn-helix domain-containing protein [Formosa sp. A9]|uniref:helix-turn-helix domain-containing protein n=1 Tax=Formosa sp. A9 TaxID=3442641 RepID=UPI003EC0CF8D
MAQFHPLWVAQFHPPHYAHFNPLQVAHYGRFLQFQQLLRDYYNGRIEGVPSVNYFASKMNLTPNYLGDVLKAYTHKSALETIHEHITNSAKKLLLESDLTNAEIAFELGFDYPNYFAKFFKKKTQLTPKQFRMKQKLTNS